MTDPERNPNSTTAESSSPAAASGLLSSSSPTDPLLSPSAAASSSSLSAPEKDDEPPATTLGQTSTVPDGKVHLTILLVSGRRKTFEFGPAETIAGVKKTVFEGWPKGEGFEEGCRWGGWSDGGNGKRDVSGG
ncbi:hypothetical protein BC936DRAFT_137533 [Jimgerdemannia flammicorona]|uniref:Uncharacterized protein n=2 Tax=Jimgerdemannia flammicorona TaxID=994334 RepID=A0A433CX59_9FUNG|nr:hypothetical protein BC936DRAFT_137533 [Jimgerdemannia flammicorona]RUS23832.1 hypothetical protein BC938DRAFT_474555 [Jimgerdemannia flammicorona]